MISGFTFCSIIFQNNHYFVQFLTKITLLFAFLFNFNQNIKQSRAEF